MVKLLLFVLCFLSLSSYTQASYPEFWWGVKGGLTISTFNTYIGPWSDSNALLVTGNVNPYDNYARYSVCLGGIMSYDFSEYIGVESGLLYIGKGGGYKRVNNSVITLNTNGASANEDDEITYVLNYLELPVLFTYTPIWRISLKAGVAVSVNVSSKLKYNYWTPDPDSEMNEIPPFNQIAGDVLEEKTEKIAFDFATPINISYVLEASYNTSSGYIYINYNQSISQVFVEQEINGYNYNTKNNVVSIGYAHWF